MVKNRFNVWKCIFAIKLALRKWQYKKPQVTSILQQKELSLNIKGIQTPTSPSSHVFEYCPYILRVKGNPFPLSLLFFVLLLPPTCHNEISNLFVLDLVELIIKQL